MAFINEKISEQDIEKYRLREINKKFLKGDVDYEWTIDRERDIYLRRMGSNWQEPQEQKISFYWKGHLLRFDLRCDVLDGTADITKRVLIWRASSNSTSKVLWLPSELEVYRAEIVNDLKMALGTSMNSGTRVGTADYSVNFQF